MQRWRGFENGEAEKERRRPKDDQAYREEDVIYETNFEQNSSKPLITFEITEVLQSASLQNIRLFLPFQLLNHGWN